MRRSSILVNGLSPYIDVQSCDVQSICLSTKYDALFTTPSCHSETLPASTIDLCVRVAKDCRSVNIEVGAINSFIESVSVDNKPVIVDICDATLVIFVIPKSRAIRLVCSSREASTEILGLNKSLENVEATGLIEVTESIAHIEGAVSSFSLSTVAQMLLSIGEAKSL